MPSPEFPPTQTKIKDPYNPSKLQPKHLYVSSPFNRLPDQNCALAKSSSILPLPTAAAGSRRRRRTAATKPTRRRSGRTREDIVIFSVDAVHLLA